MANAKRMIDVDKAKKDFNLHFGGVSHAVIANRILDEQPTVDDVEVVRCKDCKKWGGVVYGGRCKHWSTPMNGMTHFTSADDFCSYGERKDNEN